MTEYKAIAPAKINLSLHVLNKRDDGYHNLDSLVVFSKNGDEITIKKNSHSHYSIENISNHELKIDNDNLIVKAHKMLEEQLGKKLPCHIHLKKLLPIAGGIGGGSSDAATALLLLNDCFKLNLSQQYLTNLAINLGADLPVCLYKTPCYMSGIGQEIEEITNFPKLNIALINPNIATPTAKIFQNLAGNYSYPLQRKSSFTSFQQLKDWHSSHHNDLAKVAIKLVPQIEEILTNLKNIAKNELNDDAIFGMSGSGATCYLIANKPITKEMLSNINSNYSIFID